MLGLLMLLAGRCVAAPYTIGAWYFTLWHADAASSQVAASARVYGRRDAWGGVRDYAAGHGAFPVNDAAGHAVDYSGRQPLAGFYDLSDPKAVDTQLAEGARAGLSFFAFYFYIDGATGLPLPVSSPVRRFYDAPDRHGLSLLLAPIVGAEGTGKLTLETFRAKLLPLLVDYLASPAALRIEGRPALVDWFLAPAVGSDYAAMTADLRRAVRARTGKNPFVIRMMGPQSPAGNFQAVTAGLHPDAFTCFVFPMTPGQDYADWAAASAPAMRRQIADAGDTPYLPCAGTGQDARPWYKVGWNAARIDARGYTVGETPAAFRAALLGLRGFMDAGRDPMRVAILYAWNEWGEAEASIEPSKATGYAYANAVRAVFGPKE